MLDIKTLSSGCLRVLIPPARRPVTFASIVPLVSFLIVFLFISSTLHLRHVLIFSTLWPFGLLLVTPWLWWLSAAGYGGLSSVRSHWALFMRLVVVGVFIFALSEPRAVRTDDRMVVMYAIDTSGSVTQNSVNSARQYVDRVGRVEKPTGDLSGIIYFGRKPAVELPPSSHPTAEQFSLTNTATQRDGTNIAEALTMSAMMVPESQNGRIVLLRHVRQKYGVMMVDFGFEISAMSTMSCVDGVS